MVARILLALEVFREMRMKSIGTTLDTCCDYTIMPNDMNQGVLSAIGNTPLVRLNRLFKDSNLEIYAKLESLNPGGSMKDRPAIQILRRALEMGIIGAGSIIIESSSGNMGIGLAQACAYLNLNLICVVDPKATSQNISLLRAYGAEVDMVSEDEGASRTVFNILPRSRKRHNDGSRRAAGENGLLPR